jgi:hypothetical protein
MKGAGGTLILISLAVGIYNEVIVGDSNYAFRLPHTGFELLIVAQFIAGIVLVLIGEGGGILNENRIFPVGSAVKVKDDFTSMPADAPSSMASYKGAVGVVKTSDYSEITIVWLKEGRKVEETMNYCYLDVISNPHLS